MTNTIQILSNEKTGKENSLQKEHNNKSIKIIDGYFFSTNLDDKKFNKINASGKKRDMGALAVKRSKSIERIINKGSNNAKRCVELASGAEHTEEELKAAGIKYNVGKFQMIANSRARATNDPEGFVKILADANNDRILGAHIVAREAGNMIHEVATVMEFYGSAEDLARTCHAHPTHTEAIKEAALAVDKRPIHF